MAGGCALIQGPFLLDAPDQAARKGSSCMLFKALRELLQGQGTVPLANPAKIEPSPGIELFEAMERLAPLSSKNHRHKKTVPEGSTIQQGLSRDGDQSSSAPPATCSPPTAQAAFEIAAGRFRSIRAGNRFARGPAPPPSQARLVGWKGGRSEVRTAHPVGEGKTGETSRSLSAMGVAASGLVTAVSSDSMLPTFEREER